MGYRHSFLSIIGTTALVLLSVSHADITLDGSLGPSEKLEGPDFEIPANKGLLKGNNLFHSFGVFNINAGESATFSRGTITSPINNILGRVTGGTESNIDGPLRSEILGANLFLMNPAGILFGENASLDVQGSFHATTANNIGFEDGTKFNAAVPSGDDVMLSSAAPSSFGFLGDNGPLGVKGSPLSVPTGETLSLVGGDIQIDNGTLVASTGTIGLASLSASGEVELDTFTVTSNTDEGQLTIRNNSTITVGRGGPDSGIFIRSGQLTVESSSIQAGGGGGNQASDRDAIDIDVQDDMVVRDGAVIGANPNFAAPGNISINAGNLEITGDTTQILTSNRALSTENAGTLTITVSGCLKMTDGAKISASTGSGFNAGNIKIEARNLKIDNAQILASTIGSGKGGTIDITASDITLSNTAEIGARSEAEGLGNPDEDEGKSGDIMITARNIDISNGSRLSVETKEANAGSITIANGNIIRIRNGSEIKTSVAERGSGGDVKIESLLLILEDESKIVADSKNEGGNITVQRIGDGAFFPEFPEPLNTELHLSASGETEGDINVKSPIAAQAAGFLTALPAEFLDEEELKSMLQSSCAVDPEGSSTFTVVGRDSPPADPDDLETHSILLND